MGIGFLKAFVLIRTLGAVEYGRMQYIFSLIAVADILITTVDMISVRFLKESTDNSKNIVWGTLYVKLFNYLFYLIFGFFYFYYSHPEGGTNVSISLLTVGFFTFFMRSLNLSVSSFLTAFEKYFFVNIIITVESIFALSLAALLFILKIDPASSVTYIFDYNLISSAIILVMNYSQLRKKHPELLAHPSGNLYQIINSGIFQYRAYFLPMLATSLSGYLKKFAPTYLFGSGGEFESATYYDILRKIYDTVGRLGPGIIQKTVPSITRNFTNNSLKIFFKKWLTYVLLFFLLMTACGGLIQLTGFWIFKFYGINDVPNFSKIVFLLNLQLIFLTWAHSTQSLALIQENTTMIMKASILRQILFSAGLAYYSKSLDMIQLSHCVNISLLGVVAYEVIWFIRTFPGFRHIQLIYAAFAAFQLGIYYLMFQFSEFSNTFIKGILG